MDIKLKIGFGDIRFGMSEKEVLSILGNCSSRNGELYKGQSENEVVLKFDELNVLLSFSPDDRYRLGGITFFSSGWLLHKETWIGINEEVLLEKARRVGIEDLELESDFVALNSRDYNSDSNGLSFWVQNGRVSSFTIFPEYDLSGEKVIWPK